MDIQIINPFTQKIQAFADQANALKIESHADTAEAKKIDRLRKDIKAERLAMSKAANEAMAEPAKLLKDFKAKLKETEDGFKVVEKTLEAKTEQFEALKIEHEAARTARYEERAAWLTKWGAAPITDGFAYTPFEMESDELVIISSEQLKTAKLPQIFAEIELDYEARQEAKRKTEAAAREAEAAEAARLKKEAEEAKAAAEKANRELEALRKEKAEREAKEKQEAEARRLAALFDSINNHFGLSVGGIGYGGNNNIFTVSFINKANYNFKCSNATLQDVLKWRENIVMEAIHKKKAEAERLRKNKIFAERRPKIEELGFKWDGSKFVGKYFNADATVTKAADFDLMLDKLKQRINDEEAKAAAIHSYRTHLSHHAKATKRTFEDAHKEGIDGEADMLVNELYAVLDKISKLNG